MEKIKISMEWYDQKFEALLKPSNNVWCDVIKYILECSNNTEPESITDFPFPKPEVLYDEKVYGPQKCNETVKTCENCEHETSTQMCLGSYCHDRDKWVPKPTDGKLWDKVKDVEKGGEKLE